MVQKELSVVIPCFNEEENVLELYLQLRNVLGKLKKSYEILFIDDGSTDSTLKILKKINEKDKNVKIIQFRKNFGQTAALSAGFSNAKGKIIITMDGDLQNDPDDIHLLLEKIKEDYDVVSGWRYSRKDSFTKKIFSKISNWLARKLTDTPIHDSGCTLKAYRREPLKNIELYGEMHRYIPSLLAMQGFSITEVKVNHRQRKYGKTKYGNLRLLKGILDLAYITFWGGYSTRPLHFFGLLGVFQILLGSVLGLYNLLKYQLSLNVGPLLLLSVLLIIIGIQFIMIGFLGEILIRTYYGSLRETTYKIKRILK